MRSTYRIFATVALCVVASAIANAQAYAYGQSYVSLTYYASAPGLYFSTSTNYGGGFYGTYGSNFSHFDSYSFGTTADSAYFSGYGYSESAAQPPPGAWWASGYGISGNLTVTNTTGNYIFANVDLLTYCDGFSSADTWNDVGYTDEYVTLVDSLFGLQQFSVADTGIIGQHFGPDYAGWNSSTNFFQLSTIAGASGIAVAGNNFPNSAYAYTTDLSQYQVGLAPGQSDNVMFYTYMVHSAYSAAPAPAAVAPFALGLLASLRRRKRSSVT